MLRVRGKKFESRSTCDDLMCPEDRRGHGHNIVMTKPGMRNLDGANEFQYISGLAQDGRVFGSVRRDSSTTIVHDMLSKRRYQDST